MITIVDYNAGNLTSVARALAEIGHDWQITADPDTLAAADRIIFPGVGAAGAAVDSLRKSGLDEALGEAIGRGTPVLGICLGTQIIMDRSEENDTVCLGLIKGNVQPFALDMTDKNGERLKIPHMGWNAMTIQKSHPLLSGMRTDDRFYFVHSYYPAPEESGHVIATTDYGISFAAVIGFANLVATQFHPEKSGPAGLRILENFCRWRPC